MKNELPKNETICLTILEGYTLAQTSKGNQNAITLQRTTNVFQSQNCIPILLFMMPWHSMRIFLRSFFFPSHSASDLSYFELPDIMLKSSRIYIDSFTGNNKVECATSVWKVKGSNLGSFNLRPKLQIVNNLEQDKKCCYIHPLPCKNF